MNDDGKKRSQNSYYVCPVCKQPLTPTTNGLLCQRDNVEYSAKNGIPDFIVDDLTESTNLLLRSTEIVDNIAKTYEGPSWYDMMDKMHAESGLSSILK